MILSSTTLLLQFIQESTSKYFIRFSEVGMYSAAYKCSSVSALQERTPICKADLLQLRDDLFWKSFYRAMRKKCGTQRFWLYRANDCLPARETSSTWLPSMLTSIFDIRTLTHLSQRIVKVSENTKSSPDLSQCTVSVPNSNREIS